MAERSRRPAFVLLLSLLVTAALQARVISYAPYSDRVSFIAHQSRTNRHFVTVEAAPMTAQTTGLPQTYGQLVIYDSTGADEPKVIFPASDNAVFAAVAVREGDDGTPAIFAQAAAPGSNLYLSYLSNDGGATWTPLDLPKAAIAQLGTTGPDNGGPFASYRYSQVRIGTSDYPFVVALNNAVYSVSRIGMTRKLFEEATGANVVALAGRDKDGTEFLVRTHSKLIAVDLNGATRVILNSFQSLQSYFEGFITSDRAAYFDERYFNNGNTVTGVVSFARDGQRSDLFNVRWNDPTEPTAFAVPSSDWSYAWVSNKGGGMPTALYRVTNGKIEKMWEDITAPEVEALHAGASGNKVLIQVHRPRPDVDQARTFRDPALAVWRVGDPAPRTYDELFMSEQPNKGFVHLDVEAIESGTPFVFDSGVVTAPNNNGGIIVSPAPPVSGGGDVVQEWGVVRASLKQQLILPTVGRTHGAFGSDWVSDVILQNPLDTAQNVALRYVPTGTSSSATSVLERTVTLAPGEIRMVRDIVGSVFNLDSSVGALFINPDIGVTVTSRTYSRGGGGTFGFGMNAIDLMAAAASPRFPVSFAGAFPGANFRTNMTLTDTSGRGSDAQLTAIGNDGVMGSGDVTISVGPNAHQQINFIGPTLGVQAYETGALSLRPTHGTAIAAVFAIDNRTNDSTYFPPDLPASNLARVIPAIGHLDGANGSKFRSDLYLYNPTDAPRGIGLEAKSWDTNDPPSSLALTLLPHEARVIRDVLLVAFGKTGIARLRCTPQFPAGGGVRVTSRTYNVASDGGTFGFLMPPLNNFQIGGTADTLEILGAFADPNYRTNVGLVEMAQWVNPTSAAASARIEIVDASAKTIDSFTVNFPMMGGTQLNDIFRARNLTVSGPVLIRVTPLNGVIGAYATTTDNVTNDSSYLAANLAAK